MPRFCALLVVVASSIVGSGSAISFTSEHDLRTHLLHRYDKMMPPGMRLRTTIVNLTTSLTGLYAINQHRGQFSVDIYFRGHWYDPRLAYKDLNVSLGYPLSKLDLRDIENGNKIGRLVWVPDFYLTNAIKSEQPPDEVMLYVDPHGRVTWSRRFVWECRCKMYFHKFPFDRQDCGLFFTTYGDNANDVELRFVDAGDAGFASQTSNQWEDFQESRSAQVVTFSEGRFSQATMRFSMKRRSTSWIIDGIILNNVFVLISYCGLWIAKEAAPARIALSIICVLIATSNYTRVSASMPIVTYHVWIKDYLLGCIFFNLVAVLSYSLVNFGMQQKAKPVTPQAVKKMPVFSDKRDRSQGVANDAQTAGAIRERKQNGNEDSEPRGDVDDVGDPDVDDPELGKTHSVKENAKIFVGCCYYGDHRAPFVHHMTWLEWHLRWLTPISFVIFNIIMFESIDRYKN